MPTPMSPDVQAYGQLPSAEQAEELFKQKFSSMAYNVMFAKFPDMAQQIVTFKLLETDSTKGRGVGAFIFLQDNKPIYIPVIMSDSQLKPLDVFYFKDLNIFLPMNKEWLEEVSKMSLEEMGQPSDIPQGVSRDIDIRNVVMPPFTSSGRVGLASDMSFDFHAKAMFKEAEDNNYEVHPRFLEFIGNAAPKSVLDGVKIAFEKHPVLLKKLAHFHGSAAVINAFKRGNARVEAQSVVRAKLASMRAPGTVRVFTKTATAAELKETFQEKAAQAYQGILRNGIATQDTRRSIEKIALKIEHDLKLTEPGHTAGFYRLYFMDAPPDIYYIIPAPKGPSSHFDDASESYYSTYGTSPRRNATEYLIINKDGKKVWCNKHVMGEHIHDDDPSINNYKWIKTIIHGKARGSAPTVHDYGFFLCAGPGKQPQATKPFWVHSIVDTRGVKKIIGDYTHGTKYIIDDNTQRETITTAANDTLVIPKEAKWVAIQTNVREEDKCSLSNDRLSNITDDPKMVTHWLDAKLQGAEAEPVEVKKAGFEEYWVGKSSQALHYPKAIEKIASDYGISISDAAGVLIELERTRFPFMYVIPTSKLASINEILMKVAQPGIDGNTARAEGPMQGQGPAQGPAPQMTPEGGGGAPMDPSQQGMMDPSMMGGGMMDPSMMGGGMMPQQSSMSPTDLAIAEAVDKLTQENQVRMQQLQDQMQQQQQALEQESDQNGRLVQLLQQIQNRANQITQATGGMIPAGAEASPAVAARMLAPEPEPQPEPPPTPVMPEGNVNPQAVSEQINPNMLESAGDLGNAGVFDLATMSMMAASPVLHEIISSYVPNLEKAVDNLGRILLTLWMQEAEVKKMIGDLEYSTLEERLRTVFKGLGELVIKINRNAVNTNQMAQQGMMNQQ